MSRRRSKGEEPSQGVLCLWHPTLGTLTNAITREVFVEAIARLKEQRCAPKVKDRMIWMHGLLSRNELMQGASSDNTFAIRASIAASQPIGRVLEIDDSAKPDC